MRRTLTFLGTSFFFSSLFAQEFDDLELVDLGKDVNSYYHESAPIITPDGNILYFFRADHPDNTFGKEGSQDIWYSEKDQYGRWQKAVHAPSPLNNHKYNQIFSVLEDGTILLRGGRAKKTQGFSLSKDLNGRFAEPVELDVEDYDKMNKGIFSGACLSPDGQVMILYFNEKEHAKFSDLYVSFSLGENKWSSPKKLPNTINSSRDEFGPYIAPDNVTMYYAAVRTGGHGSTDIYATKRLDDTWLNWSEPLNLGPKINTSGFDAYFSIDAKGNIFTTRAYMSPVGGSLDILGLKPLEPTVLLNAKLVDKKTGESIMGAYSYKYKGNDPVPTMTRFGEFTDTIPGKGKYKFIVSAEGYASIEEDYNLKTLLQDTLIKKTFALMPIETSLFVKGTTRNAKSQEALSAKIAFSQDQLVLGNTQSGANGVFVWTLSQPTELEVSASSEGYLSSSTPLDASQAKAGDTLYIDLALEPIEVGTTVRLNNIFFDFNASTLRSESFPELDKVVTFLVENGNITIEIGGHTDSQGSDDYNQKLSQGRADAVREYLISEGISSGRITAVGYGESMPETTNDTEEGRQQNRRVVFRVLEL